MYVSVKFGFGEIKKLLLFAQNFKIKIDYGKELSNCRIAS